MYNMYNKYNTNTINTEMGAYYLFSSDNMHYAEYKVVAVLDSSYDAIWLNMYPRTKMTKTLN